MIGKRSERTAAISGIPFWILVFIPWLVGVVDIVRRLVG